MKVRILKGVATSPWNLAAFVGEVITVDVEIGTELIEAERAEAVEDKAKKAAPKSEKATAKAPAKAETATKK